MSVVLPVYRPDPRFFAAAIDSVLAQTFEDLELVIVEDPSDQPGREIVAQRSDRRIRYFLNHERTSLPRQHNRAVATSRGEFIARFDADDLCEPERIAKQVEFLRTHPDVDLVGSQTIVIDETGSVIGERRYPTEPDEIRRALHRVNPLSGSNVMFRRRVVEEAGGWLETGAAAGLDYEWFCRLASRGYRLANHPLHLIRYRVHRQQLKTTRWRASIRTALRVKMRYWWREMNMLSRLYMLLEIFALTLPNAAARLIYRRLYVRRRG